MKRLIARLLVPWILGSFPTACDGQSPVSTSQGVPASVIAQQVSQIPIGASVEVRFNDRKKIRGYLFKVASDGFSFKTGNSTTGTLHQAAFRDVKLIKMVRPTHTPIAAWAVAGVIVAAVVIAVAVVVVETHNE